MVNSRLGLSAYALAAMLVGCSGNTQDVETDDNLGTVRQAIVGPSALGGGPCAARKTIRASGH